MTLWAVYKLGRQRGARGEHLVDLPAPEAMAHAAMLNKRFSPEYVYWAQPKTMTATVQLGTAATEAVDPDAQHTE